MKCKSETLPLNDGLPGDELAQDDQVMSRVAQMGVDPLRRKHLVKCLCYHGRDLCWGCRSTSMSTLSYPLEVKEKYPQREVQQILSKAPLILGLDGGSKMSKSRNNSIMLSATEDETAQLIKKAKT